MGQAQHIRLFQSDGAPPVEDGQLRLFPVVEDPEGEGVLQPNTLEGTHPAPNGFRRSGVQFLVVEDGRLSDEGLAGVLLVQAQKALLPLAQPS